MGGNCVSGVNAESGRRIRTYRDLDVYRIAFDLAMELFEISKRFPSEERYSLVSQVRRSSRSVAANVAEGWRKRRYRAAFVGKLSDAETEAGETQAWIEFAVKCGYLNREDGLRIHGAYEALLGKLVGMIHHADQWVIPKKGG